MEKNSNFYKISFALLFTCSYLILNGQLDPKINLLQFSKEDTNEVHSLLKLASMHRDSNQLDKALSFQKEALMNAEHIQFANGILKASFDLGKTYYLLGDNYKSLQYLNASIIEFKKVKNFEETAKNYLWIGRNKVQLRDFDEAITNYLAGIKIVDNNEIPWIIGHNLRLALADLYCDKNDFTNALIHYDMAKDEIAKVLDTSTNQALPLTNSAALHFKIARMFMLMEQYPICKENNLIALNYIQEALKIDSNIINMRWILSIYFNLGLVLEAMDEHKNAIPYYEKSLELAIKFNDKRAVRNIFQMGNSFYNLGEYDKALLFYKQAMEKYVEINDLSGIQKCHKAIGTIHSSQGNYDEALKHMFESLTFSERIKDTIAIIISYEGIGVIYSESSRDESSLLEALKYFEKAHYLALQLNNKKLILTTLMQMGSVRIKQNNLELAYEIFKGMLQACQELGAESLIAQVNNYLAVCKESQGDYNNALEYLQAAGKEFSQIGDKHRIAELKKNIGLIHFKLGNYEEAKSSIIQGLELAKEIGRKDLIKSSYGALHVIDSVMGDYKNALYHFKLSRSWKDSILNETSANTISELKIKFESEQKDKEIQILQNEKQISLLEIELNRELLFRMESEQERMRVEKLFHLRQLDLFAREKELQVCEIEQNEAKLQIKEVEAIQKQDQLNTLSRISKLQGIALKKQKQAKKYMWGVISLICLLSLFVYNNYMTRQQLKLQMLRNKIASDLHDDVGSTLSSIALFSQMAKEQSNDVMPLLNTIQDHSKKMLDAMGDIVWTINPENDQFDKIILRMKNFAFALLGARNIDFVFEADDKISELHLPMDVRKNLYLIFKEATNNLVKYSNAETASFTITEKNDMLTLEIRDDGKGFDPELQTEGNGLKNMKKRAEEIRGNLVVESKRELGTIIRLNVAI